MMHQLSGLSIFQKNKLQLTAIGYMSFYLYKAKLLSPVFHAPQRPIFFLSASSKWEQYNTIILFHLLILCVLFQIYFIFIYLVKRYFKTALYNAYLPVLHWLPWLRLLSISCNWYWVISICTQDTAPIKIMIFLIPKGGCTLLCLWIWRKVATIITDNTVKREEMQMWKMQMCYSINAFCHFSLSFMPAVNWCSYRNKCYFIVLIFWHFFFRHFLYFLFLITIICMHIFDSVHLLNTLWRFTIRRRRSVYDWLNSATLCVFLWLHALLWYGPRQV